ncbi:hypothetical protein FHS39_003405 [Streptomyces olivoverticillatus]|uniref:Uncharacterized protein n=1 Tax=Streptomyces olivoverticillatus TaxID=66427 RepID=A0A7W7LRF4_9ACTN|nr:hypothetical protein [Streptomyces olivoverticillatus]MBB4894371.1 hypothetical protein [Streptomyces olivoverticillatus]
MNATQQHMLDAYRASVHQQTAPPAPGTNEWQMVREFRTWRAFRAVVDERVAARRARLAALFAFLRPSTVSRATTAPAPAATPAPAPAPAPAPRPSAGRPDAVRLPADRLGDGCGTPAQCRS